MCVHKVEPSRVSKAEIFNIISSPNGIKSRLDIFLKRAENLNIYVETIHTEAKRKSRMTTYCITSKAIINSTSLFANKQNEVHDNIKCGFIPLLTTCK